MSTDDLVFVYGSLKRGYYAHHRMKDATFAGEALTREPHYRMVAFPWSSTPNESYPGILRDGQGHISGEVYQASAGLLAELDVFEIVGRDYIREKIDLADGRSAWAYLSINIEEQGVLNAHKRIGYQANTSIYCWLKNDDD
ncbi:MAG: gamma-glutamylcyclotransferase [Alphaproteobacteria bacterium]|nr:gamma-glutamylcyclotransferase [Alphaproteobacteria bacterium]MCD8525654.1 gamma-glutamylcyclotransferase [Alphaproteobacteria bacterium]MCD8570036.1 gamma-glutamylcyclotransferase [Alphaproteobacteria bacterium]